MKLKAAALLLGAFAFSTLAFGANPGAFPVQGPFAVNFVGFCDYLSITQAGVLNSGVHNFDNCGGGYVNGVVNGNNNIGFGTAPYTASPAPGYTIGSTVSYPNQIIYLFDAANSTWANYISYGAGSYFINSGSYTIGSGAAKAVPGTRPTTKQ